MSNITVVSVVPFRKVAVTSSGSTKAIELLKTRIQSWFAFVGLGSSLEYLRFTFIFYVKDKVSPSHTTRMTAAQYSR